MKKAAERMIEMYVAPIIDLHDMKRTAFLSEVRITDKQLGILAPDEYWPVAEKTIQCKRLFTWAYEEASSIIKRLHAKNIPFDFFTLYAPQKFFEDDNSVQKLIEYTKQSDFTFSELAFEVYPDCLLDMESKSYKNISLLRDNGARIILLNYACENFPLSKIFSLPVDIFCLDDFVVNSIDDDSIRQGYANMVIEMAKNLGKKIIYKNIDSKQSFAKLNEILDFGCGRHLGNFVKNNYIRMRWLEKI